MVVHLGQFAYGDYESEVALFLSRQNFFKICNLKFLR